MPTRARLTRALTLPPVAMLLCGALLLTGCGATAPQLPTKQANRLSSALAAIAEDCGRAYQRDAYDRKAHPPKSLEAAAATHSRQLAKIAAAYPQHVYQSQTLREVAAQASRYLRECRLDEAATAVRRPSE